MPANEFEKKVQQKMDELQMDPHLEVWEGVERRIRKEKKRRGGFYWLILAGLLVGGGTIAFFSLNKNKRNELAVDKEKQPGQSIVNVTPVIEPRTSRVDTIVNEDEKIKTGERTITGDRENPSANLKTSSATSTQPVQNESDPGKVKVNKNKKNPTVARKGSITPPVGNEISPVEKKDTLQTVSSSINTQNRPEQANNVPDTSTVIAGTVNLKDEKQETAVQPVITPIPSTSATETRESKDKKTRSRHWGLLLQAGISHTPRGIHFFERRVYSSSLSTPGSATGSSSIIAGKVRPGPSFSGGIYTLHPVSPRLSIYADLTYSYLSTRMHVGSPVDTMAMSSNPYLAGIRVDRFYRSSGDLTPIGNRYHFFSFSSQLSWQVIRGNKFSLSWDNGVSYKWLFASRALHYDWGFRGYYEDQRRLTRHHLFMTTGVSIPVSRRLTLHPFGEYSLTPVLRKTDTLRTHFTNYGIRIKFSLGDKK